MSSEELLDDDDGTPLMVKLLPLLARIIDTPALQNAANRVLASALECHQGA